MNPIKTLEYQRKYNSKYYKNYKDDIQYILRNKGVHKTRFFLIEKKTNLDEFQDTIGCSSNFFRKWIQWQFNSKMNWNNYGIKGGYWDLDHVNPISNFILSKNNNFTKCFHWSNVRPLKRTLNGKKHKKIEPFNCVLQELKVNHFKKIHNHLHNESFDKEQG